jgi:DHA1 family multidrug resistance protein-like MFS transporter
MLIYLCKFLCYLSSKVIQLLTICNSAASTVAANIILRSTVAAGFPLFTTQMFENMGIQWACTLLGCLAALMIPIPMVFRAYGPLLRSKSKLFK